ncbi:MAG: hypothetical protein COW88_00185 [Candidatus Lloydbacteria bacterium CG22_combo_CG10-13_8_21_14_all_47_15]|uniref:Bacterial type II secretion system protein E domain-containing protein n=1 Tax=Candidatus Lloydbacteria bacterium CG22_combo_CG10-13_8_21_14_all_47_15 TaxID=1974635 RepID=A0A2H0CX65_9BACT|nr:MAG: hypothetical protein COW88_00185 [Candidatus Lloydbacteria bacterium CG22_combo_CG10-13_8_21_14_all_47_15]
MAFLDYLVQKGIIEEKEAVLAVEKAATESRSIEELLSEHGLSIEDQTQYKGEYLGVPIRKTTARDLSFDVLQYIPEEAALHYGFVPIGMKDNVLEVGMINPDNVEARDALRFITSKTNIPFKIFLISEQDFKSIISNYTGLTGQVDRALSEIGSQTDIEGTEAATKQAPVVIGDDKDYDTGKVLDGEKPFEAKMIEDAPVTKIVAVILRHAVEGNASDIHIEPVRDKIRVRFRVDGVLYTSLLLPTSVHGAVVARVKILSNMKLDEKRKPQDGRFSAKIENRVIDFRVSTFPTYYGEKVVMRILDPEKGFIALEDLGMSERNIALVRKALAEPYGMILLTGPTGSGKTTTLYSMLSEIDRDGKNVLSLEDPVEYSVSGMNQSQVRPEIGYDFANGLRTTLRQDPDVIMVGEIRDKETAQLAVQAALTGHLVFSTLHTNNATGVIPRLVDMGIDPYLIAPTLRLAIAQRLVRTLCPGEESRKPMPVDGSIKIMIDKEFESLPAEYRKNLPLGTTLYEASSTPACPRGTRGRMAVYEMFEMNREIERIILKETAESAVFDAVRKGQGMLTMKEDAIIKAFEGRIPFEEVNTL